MSSGSVKLHVVIAVATGFTIGLLYALLIWAFRSSVYPGQLRTATVLSLLANVALEAICIVILVRIGLLRSVDLLKILEMSVAQILSFLVTATVVFDLLID